MLAPWDRQEDRYFCAGVLSSIIDRFLLGSEDVLRTVTTVFYIANEAMSILENVGKVGLPLPQKLQNFLSHFEKYQGSRK